MHNNNKSYLQCLFPSVLFTATGRILIIVRMILINSLHCSKTSPLLLLLLLNSYAIYLNRLHCSKASPLFLLLLLNSYTINRFIGCCGLSVKLF